MLLSLLTLGAASAAADTVTVTPSTGLPASGQLVQVSGTFSGGPVFFVVAAHRGAQTYCNTTAYFPAAPAGAPFTLTVAVGTVLRHRGAMAAGDPCPDPAMPGEPLCETGGPNSCALELRRAGTGEVLASAPIVFDFPPPVCSDFTTPGRSSGVLVFPASQCSDPHKRDFAIEILDGPHHGTLGPLNPANGQRKYTPAYRYIGPDQFTFQAVVGDQRSNVATMHLNMPGPDYSGRRSRYFRAFHCGRLGRRSFDFGFRPAGGSGRLTPPSFTSAKYLFGLFTDADPARPHLSVSSRNSWVAYLDTDAFAVPGNGRGCTGPVGPLTLRQGIAAPVKTARATDIACKFKSRFTYIGLYGTRYGGVPPTVRKVVFFEIIVKRGRVKGHRIA